MKFTAIAFLSALLAACSSDRKDTVWWGNEKTIIELKNELALAQYRASQLAPVSAEEAGETPASSVPELREDIAALTELRGALGKEIATMTADWDGFRAMVLEERRGELTGRKFGEFKTGDGKVYKDVEVTRIDDGGVSLRHTDGTARLRFEDLDAQEHAYFGLDGELAAAAHDQERTHRAAYEKWVNEKMALALKEKATETRAREKEESRLASARALASARRSTTSASVSPLTSTFGKLGDTSTFSTGSSRYSRRSSYGSYYRRPTVYYYNYSTPSCYSRGVPFFRSDNSTPNLPWQNTSGQ